MNRGQRVSERRSWIQRSVDRAMRPLTNDWRDYEIRREKLREQMSDFLLRLAELILICGAVVFVEDRTHSGHIASAVVSGLVAIYAQARASSGMLSLMAEHNLSPVRQRLFYWLIVILALVLWGAIQWFTNAVVPLIASAEAGAH